MLSDRLARGGLETPGRAHEINNGQSAGSLSHREDYTGDRQAERRKHRDITDCTGSIASGDAVGSDSSRTPIFLWKGRNYLDKMSHDLEFLDSAVLSAPVSTWLGFSVKQSPFLIPPEDYDVCASLLRDHEERRESAASRRMQRRKDSGGRRRTSSAGNIERSASYSLSRRRSSRASDFVGGEMVQGPTQLASEASDGTGSEITEASLGSGSADLVNGFEEVEGEIPSELSSGEEEEVRWRGGGCIDAPIIPPLPESVRRKASAAAEVLEGEGAGNHMLDRCAQRVLRNSRLTRTIIEETRRERSPRMELLTERSSREGMHDELKKRHVGSTRLVSVAVDVSALSGSLRAISTAPADAGRTGGGTSDRVTDRAKRLFVSRGGVRVSSDGWTETVRGSLTAERDCGAGENIATFRTPEASACSSTAEMSDPVSLQASTSSMSTRARSRAVAGRLTAARWRRKGGKIVILDPAKSKATREKAAKLMQALFLGVRARESIRRLRRKREQAATTLGRVWRGCTARALLREKQCVAGRERLRKQAEDKKRNRAAHFITIFFHDIVYRKRRVRGVRPTTRCVSPTISLWLLNHMPILVGVSLPPKVVVHRKYSQSL